MRRLIAPFVACWLFLQGGVIAQERPAAVSTLTTTDTGASSVCVGCAVGTTTPAGTLLTSTVQANSTITSGSSAAAGGLISNGPVATARGASFRTAGVNRWSLYTNSTAEAGANAGSDLRLDSYTDAGALIGSAMSVTRSSLAASFAGAMRLGTGTTAGGWGVNAAGDFTLGASNHIADSVGTPTTQDALAATVTTVGTDYSFLLNSAGAAKTTPWTTTFGHAWSTNPICVASSSTGTVVVVSANTGSVTLTPSTNTSTLYVLCRSY